VEEQRVAEIAQLAPGDRMDLGLVPKQAAQRCGIDRRFHGAPFFQFGPTVAR
jgi:hypothetical protein